MSQKYEKAMEGLTEDLQELCRETTEALERATEAQAEFLSKATEVMTRGYVGFVNGTVGAMVHAYVGFLDGFSRAWRRRPKSSPADGGTGGGHRTPGSTGTGWTGT